MSKMEELLGLEAGTLQETLLDENAELVEEFVQRTRAICERTNASFHNPAVFSAIMDAQLRLYLHTHEMLVEVAKASAG